jgi:KUP system potassium uptake protein
VTATFGYMETPSIPKALAQCRREGLNVDVGGTSFFLSRRSLRRASRSQMPRWQERLYILLARRAQDASEYFELPADRVVEIGVQVAV